MDRLHFRADGKVGHGCVGSVPVVPGTPLINYEPELMGLDGLQKGKAINGEK